MTNKLKLLIQTEIKKILNENELRSVRVTYTDGTVITTDMAAGLTDDQITNYFKIGKEFNLGWNTKTGEEDNLQKVTKVEMLK